MKKSLAAWYNTAAMKKKEIWILVVVAVGALIGLLVLNRRNTPYAGSSTSGNFKSQSGVTVAVQHASDIVLEFDPEVNAIYTVDGDYGGLQIEVKDGSWRVINEKCPNHICASMGWANKDSLIPITCLPNNLMIFVESDNNAN